MRTPMLENPKVLKAVIGATRDWNPDYNDGYYYRIEFQLPLMPPSVNHYVKHAAKGVHFKSDVAEAFERDFGTLMPKGFFVQSKTGRFAVKLEYWPGPKGRGDVDNYNKQPLDCCAKAGMFRDKKGKEVSDAWVKHLTVIIHDSDDDRKIGPQIKIAIEAI